MRLTIFHILAFTLILSGCQVADTVRDPSTNPEEARLGAATVAMPHVLANKSELDANVALLTNSQDHETALSRVQLLGDLIWSNAARAVQAGDLDDRPLYWQRLYINNQLRNSSFGFKISESQRNELIEAHETTSRGQSSLGFDKQRGANTFRVILSGFDPFLLDRNLEQVNPSGVIALALDGKQLKVGNLSIELQTTVMPVRYGDFDAGELESWLAPIYLEQTADMVTTVSMGRSDFDLEVFPGLRRSATAPGNLNVITGASSTNPIIPVYPNAYPATAEFVEFSLPAVMQNAEGTYNVNLNNQVTTLEQGKLSPSNLSELNGLTAVQGGGGGYLSNEISYRSINLRQHLKSSIPTGHIHTPRITSDDQQVIQEILNQTETMILLGAESIKSNE